MPAEVPAAPEAGEPAVEIPEKEEPALAPPPQAVEPVLEPAAEEEEAAPDAARRGKPSRADQGMELYQRARRLIQSDPATAETLLLRAIRLNPRAASAHRLLGNFYAEQGNTKKACRHLQKFLKLSPRHPQGKAIREQLGRFGCPQ